MERQLVYIGRHGKKLKNGSLAMISVPVLYGAGSQELRDFVASLGFSPEKAYLRHSDEKRTLDTGRAVLAGAYGLEVPKSRTALESLALKVFTGFEDPRLGYDSIKANWEAFESMGLDTYLGWLVQNPDANQLGGQEVTPWNQMLQTGREALRDAVTSAYEKNTPLGTINSHAGLTEPLILAAINSRRMRQIIDPKEIGGWLPMEGHALMRLEGYKGQIEVNGTAYKIDLADL